MSEQTTVRPPRPVTGPDTSTLTPEQVAWQGEVFRRKAWESKKGAQIALLAELKKAIPDALDGMFPTGGAAALGDLAGNNPMKHKRFRTYHTALGNYEKTKDAKTESTLRDAATNYIGHSDIDFGDEVDDKAKRRQRLDACQKTLDDLTRTPLLKKMTTLPWDSETAMAAAAMKAELDLASLPQGQQFAAPLDADAGVNASFWITKPKGTGAGVDKSFLFKPPTDKRQYGDGDVIVNLDRSGVPNGGEPAREALASRAADVLGAMTGIDFKFPQTHIVAVDKARFAADGLGDKVMGRDGSRPLVGSLQEFSPDAKEMRHNPPSMKHAVPAQRCQELAVLDLAMLHLGRHAGNYMMTGDDQAADLIPIDNGLSFPNTGLDDLNYMSSTHNALLSLPGSHQPFSPEMLAKIAQIQPKFLQSALSKERDAIETVHGSAKGMITDAALATSARSMSFLKLAAPTLSPAAVQYALARYAPELLDPALEEQKFTAVAQRIIAQVAKDQAALADFFTMTGEERDAGETALDAAGWSVDDYRSSPAVFMKLLNSKAAKPQSAAKAGDWDGRTAVPGRDMQAEIGKMKQVFPTAIDKQVLKWIKFEELGGMPAVEKAKNEIGMSPGLLSEYISKPRLPLLYDYLARSAPLSAATSNVDVQEEINRVRSKTKAVMEIAELLDPTDAQAIRKSVARLVKNEQRLDIAKRIAGLSKERDVAISKCQALLRRDLAALPPSDDRAIKADKKDAENAIQSGMVFAARKLIDQLGLALGQETNPASAKATTSPPQDQPSRPTAQADAGPDPEVQKVIVIIDNLRAKAGSNNFKQLLDNAQIDAQAGRMSAARLTIKTVMVQMQTMQKRIEALEGKATSDNLRATVDAAQKRYAAGQIEEANRLLTRVESVIGVS